MLHHGAPAEDARTQTGAPQRSQSMPICGRFGCPRGVATVGGLLSEGLGNRFWDSQVLSKSSDPATFRVVPCLYGGIHCLVCRFFRLKFGVEIQLVQPGFDQKISILGGDH